jgi:cysteine desulfurase
VTGPRIYLDYNATAPLRPAARDAMFRALDLPGNASSVHAEGRAARAEVEAARRAVAALVGADPRGVIFTASATEAANLALTPTLALAGRPAPERLLVGATEHSCILTGHRFAAAETLAVDGSGVIDLEALAAALARPGRVLLALQAANNETGVLQPVAEAARLVHAAGGMVVCDAVQAAGRIATDLATTAADALILSSHKLGGPKGAGALVFANPDSSIGLPLLRGGGQERGARAGTEDVAAIAGFSAAAVEVAAGWREEAVRALQRLLEEGLRERFPEVRVIGAEVPRLPNTTCFAVPGVAAATLLMALDLAGVALSAGSACSSGKIARSHVLDAMGEAPHISGGALRASVGWASVEGDVIRLLEALEKALATIRQAASKAASSGRAA